MCAAIISNHVSVFSLGVCELPPPGQPICVVVAVMVMASKLSLLPAVLFHSLRPNNDAAQVHILLLFENLLFLISCLWQSSDLCEKASLEFQSLQNKR